MDLFWYIVIFSFIGGVLSLTFAALLLINKRVATTFAHYAMPFAAGALLAAVFFDLFPEGAEHGDVEVLFTATLAGIVLFFFAERFIKWFHHHHQHDGDKKDASVALIIVGDSIHNILDGVAIAAAFMVSIPTGIVTTLAVAAHEIPQEIGIFGVLLNKGMRRGKVLFVNILISLTAVAAAIATYLAGSGDALPMDVIFGLSAGFLLYVALSDIIPSLHESREPARAFKLQPFLLLAGVAVVWVATVLAHSVLH